MVKAQLINVLALIQASLGNGWLLPWAQGGSPVQKGGSPTIKINSFGLSSLISESQIPGRDLDGSSLHSSKKKPSILNCLHASRTHEKVLFEFCGLVSR